MNDPDFLIESIPNELHGPRPERRWNVVPAVIAPLLLSAIASYVGFAAAGLSLGLFLSGLVWAALFSGPFIAAETTAIGRCLAGFGVVHGVAAVWFFAAIRGGLPIEMWAWSYAALASMVLAMGGIVALLRRIRCGAIGSGAIVTVLAVAWLFWPIWLSPALHGDQGDKVVSILVLANPVFAVNAVLREKLGYWVEQSIAYHYTSLSDDVSYSLPHGVGGCVGLHAAIGVVASLLSWRRGSSRAA